MPYHRRGSMVIYCLALVALMVVVGAAFLRASRADVAAHDASTQQQLAMSAARGGCAQAIEQILRDAALAALPMATGAGTVNVSPVPTFLDGPYRAPFVSLTRPNEIVGVDHNQPATAGMANEADDVRAENPVVLPLLRYTEANDGLFSWHRPFSGGYKGNHIYDGRGRFIEPEFHGTARPDPSLDPSPVVAARFSDPAPAMPARSGGLFLDRFYNRISTGDPLDDRLRARYRLRYAVGVEDLGGHLLVNPDPALDSVWAGPAGQVGAWQDPAAAYRTPASWSGAARNAFYNMARRFTDVGPSSPLRFEHVFLGRGNSVNADRSVAGGFPCAFPDMLRNQLAPPAWWGRYATQVDLETDGLYPGATQAGGSFLWQGGASESEPIMHALLGPQLSWTNLHYAVRGNLPFGADSPMGQDTATDRGVAMFTCTPYGQRLVRSTRPPVDWRWYEGRVDTPWHVNLLTASPFTINCMLSAYTPPGSKVLVLTVERYYEDGSRSAQIGSDYVLPTPIRSGLRQRDLFTRLSSPAFATYAPPSDASLDPNWQIADPRSDSDRYPGALWWPDDPFGKDIDVNHHGSLTGGTSYGLIGKCCKTGQGFYTMPSDSEQGYRLGGGQVNPSPPAGYDEAGDLWIRSSNWFGQEGFKQSRSYVNDVICAFTQAVAIARAAWAQYPCRAFVPSNATMSATLRDPSAYDTLEDIDRAFLRQLGENFDTPGDGVPKSCVLLSDTKDFAQTYTADGFTPSNTIASLVAKGLITPQQANVMERYLNDFRMSFLGAGPGYSESYRPLDFSGDGVVHCSAYAATGNATDAANGLDWHRPAAAAGRGPTPDHWFSLSGCFYIGRSHHFRIFTRGELFDNLVQKPVANATLETVVVADPEGTDPAEVRVLYQRWLHNRYTGDLSHQGE